MEKIKVFKFMAFNILLILFYVGYFRLVFTQFSKQQTNTITYDESFKSAEPPTITICFDPAFKSSVLESYNVTKEIFYIDHFSDVFETKKIKVLMYIVYFG